jgi:hypothetical protein
MWRFEDQTGGPLTNLERVMIRSRLIPNPAGLGPRFIGAFGTRHSSFTYIQSKASRSSLFCDYKLFGLVFPSAFSIFKSLLLIIFPSLAARGLFVRTIWQLFNRLSTTSVTQLTQSAMLEATTAKPTHTIPSSSLEPVNRELLWDVG